MKKKLLIILLLITLIATCLTAFVACGEERTALIEFNYVITTQYTETDTYTYGKLLNKPENPTFENTVFNAGYGKTEDGYIGEFDWPITNPRMGEGYDVNINYYFMGWYTEPEYIRQWDFSEDRVYRDITLYAKWIVKTW